MGTQQNEPLEIERKFLIRMPDIRWLEGLPGCTRVDIVQTYLLSGPRETLRVRRWTEGGVSICYRTLKRKLTHMTRVELEDRISEEEYAELLRRADPARRPIRKARYRLPYDGQLFEVDVFPFWADQALMEIELKSEGDEVRYPHGLEIIREVTDDENYTNAALAARY